MGEAADRVAVHVDALERPGRREHPLGLRAGSLLLLVEVIGAASSAAAPQPTMAGTFSNPARRARSWSPPTSSGSRRSPRRTSSAPTPGGPPILCALTLRRSAPSGPEVDRHVAGGLRGVDVDEHAPRTAGLHDLGHGLGGAHLVVAPLDVDERGVRPDRVEQRGGIDPALAVAADQGERRGGRS